MSLLLALTATPAVVRRGGGGGRRWRRYEEPPKVEETEEVEFREVPQPIETEPIAFTEVFALAKEFERAYWDKLGQAPKPVPSAYIRAVLPTRTAKQIEQEELDIAFLASLDL